MEGTTQRCAKCSAEFSIISVACPKCGETSSRFAKAIADKPERPSSGESWKTWILLFVVGLGIALIIAVTNPDLVPTALMEKLGSIGRFISYIFSGEGVYWLGFLFVLCLAIGALILDQKCPNCGKHFAARTINKRESERHLEVRTDSHGRQRAVNVWKEFSDKQCSNCGHNWEVWATRESENRH